MASGTRGVTVTNTMNRFGRALNLPRQNRLRVVIWLVGHGPYAFFLQFLETFLKVLHTGLHDMKQQKLNEES